MPKEIVLPDYEDSILNFSCSILKHFGVKPKHNTIPDVDKILDRNYKHVVVILLDGMGVNILEKHLKPDDFLRKHFLREYSSVFPPTTTASTTTFLSGLSPIEHGWLGWDVYFEKEDKIVTCFTNNLQKTKIPAAEYNVTEKYFSYKKIDEQINDVGLGDAEIIFPFGPNGFPRLNRWANEIVRRCSLDEKNFTYAYWTNPDHQLHLDGTSAGSIHEIIKKLNEKIEEISRTLQDTVMFVTADHGHLDINSEYLEINYPELVKMLVRRPDLEPRVMSFYVKPEFMETFPEEFKKNFGECYKLFTRQEILDKKLFGPGKPHRNLTGLGDFIAVAVDEKILLWDENDPPFKSHHAGLTKEEMRIPLICFQS